MSVTLELGEERFHGLKSAGARELEDNGVVSVIIMGKSGVEFSGIEEDLKCKIEILLAGDHGDKALGVEAPGPGFDWRRQGRGEEDWARGGRSVWPFPFA